MTDQYETIAAHYSSMEDLPGDILAKASFLRVLGDVKGYRVLDLACGTGSFGRLLLGLGAAEVVGVDISSTMVRVGQKIDLESEKTEGQPKGIIYHVSDCSKPLDHLRLEREGFDLVIANWLFNYAASGVQLQGMWRNVADYLKPGCRFVGININLDPHAVGGLDFKYGIHMTIIETFESGFKVHLEAATDPKIEFDSYWLSKDEHERAAVQADMAPIVFGMPQREDLPEGADMKFWQAFMGQPYFHIYSATKTSCRAP